MNTENIVRQLRVLWRTDRIIAEIRMRHMLVGLGLRAFAALIARPEDPVANFAVMRSLIFILQPYLLALAASRTTWFCGRLRGPGVSHFSHADFICSASHYSGLAGRPACS